MKTLRSLYQQLIQKPFGGKKKNAKKYWKERFNTDRDYILFMLILEVSVVRFSSVFFNSIEYESGTSIVVYLILNVLIGMPLVMSQMLLGLYGRVGFLKVWMISPILYGLGYAMLFSTVFRTSELSRNIGLFFMYSKDIFGEKLSWSNCSNFNSISTCKDAADNETKHMTCCTTVEKEMGICLDETSLNFASFDYFSTLVPHAAQDEVDWIPNLQECVANIIAWILVFAIITRELKTISKLISLSFLVTLVSLIILTLPIFAENDGITELQEHIQVKYPELLSSKVWIETFKDILEHSYIDSGLLISISSWSPGKRYTNQDAALLCVIKLVMTLVYVIWAYGVLGVVADHYDISDYDCLTLSVAGEYFLYTMMPEFIMRTSLRRIFGACYFLCFGTVNQVMNLSVIFYTILRSLLESHPDFRNRHRILAACLCLLGFLISLPRSSKSGRTQYTVLRKLVIFESIIFITVCFVICVFVLYGVETLCDDFDFMLGRQITRFWKYSWFIMPPVVLIFSYLTLYELLVHVTNLSELISSTILFCLVVSPIPVLAIFKCVVYGKRHNFARLFVPGRNWGPREGKEKEERKYFRSGKSIRYKCKVLHCKHDCLLDSKELQLEEERLEMRREVFNKFIEKLATEENREHD